MIYKAIPLIERRSQESFATYREYVWHRHAVRALNHCIEDYNKTARKTAFAGYAKRRMTKLEAEWADATNSWPDNPKAE